MLLKRFHGTAVNGYLDFDLDFFDNLTFLTGINGTGKTSALNAISALLMPRLDYLASHTFEAISVSIEENGETVRLSAERVGEETILRCSKFPEVEISFEAFDDDPVFHTRQNEEMEQAYYKNLMSMHEDSEILMFILNLPTPMFLGLDRRSRSNEPDNQYARRMPLRRSKKRKRNIFGSSLSNSLAEAQYFAETTVFECRQRKNLLDRKFRDNLIFELLNFPLNDFSGFMEDEIYITKAKLASAKRNVSRIPKLLDLDNDAILPRLNELFEFIEKNLILASQGEEEDREDAPWDRPSFRARMALSENRSSIEKINALSGLVTEYTKNIDKIFEKVQEFVDKVNSFICDSDKRIEFDDGGQLGFRVGKDLEERDLRSLSSGEIQLIVIFAHLYFNPETKNANIFIIDEPELSLHVQWQAKFVESVLGASSNTQFVMATHSPTVIMNRVDLCKEILGKN